MTKQRVLMVIDPTRRDIPRSLPRYHEFKEEFDVVEYDLVDHEQFRHDLQTEFQDVSAIWATLVFIKNDFNQFIPLLPQSVKVVGWPGVGFDRVDAVALRARGIVLTNIGSASAEDVADMALWLTLGAFRLTSFFDGYLRKLGGNILKTREILGGTDVDVDGTPLPPTDPDQRNWAEGGQIGGKLMDSPHGKVAALVGLGSIGKEIAKRLWAVGMEIHYTKRTELTAEEKAGLPFETVYHDSFDSLIKEADLIMLAVPQTPETTNLISRESLKKVKKGVRIVNIGRGSAIDEDALIEGLDSGVVNSAGLDVFQHEPNVDTRFLNRFDVVVAPHLGAFTKHTREKTSEATMDSITDVLRGGKGLNVVN